MIDFKIKINGLKQVESYLKKYAKDTEKRFEKAKDNVGKLVTKTAKRYAPRESSNLEDDITYEVKKNQIRFVVPRNSPAGDYAYWLHEGRYKLGRKSRAKGSGVGRKFIQRAIDDNERTIVSEFEKIFRRR